MSAPSAASTPRLFANRNFTLLFTGSAISAVGDQFTLVALPWLVLKLTGNPGALGLVLMVMALPRAAFMLIGGAVVDRMSPRRVLLVSRGVNTAFVVLLAALVLGGGIRMSLLYLIAAGIGLSTAFAFPAASSILPQMLPREQLQAANGLVMGLRQASMILGPVLAGLLIAGGAAPHAPGALANAHGLADARGMGLSFAVDALSFVVSLASLLLIRLPGEDRPKAAEGGVLADVVKGIRHIGADAQLRAFFLYLGLVSVFVGGPVQVGLPVLADTRLHHGAASLGLLMTSYGGGILLGNLASQRSLRLSGGRLGLLILGFDTLAGLLLAALPQAPSTTFCAILLALMGCFAGVAQVGVVSWIQRRVPIALMGRTMSLLFFVLMGVGPISAALAGALLKVTSLRTLFMGAGFLLSAIALACLSRPNLRGLGVGEAERATDPEGVSG
ncbi:MFS transporter [Geothrix limicola]|uniref:MFS transporter n=1 Tax=Geothrix limicola TaxID=2927978 RepID=A0ABQ5QG98_9BACT|nr:MFS transporter [Geothrix limicola]GLH73561.1 MFS transporter [Geothrix limicola]